MHAGSTVSYLSIAMIRKLRVMVPDKVLQNEFASFVAQIDKSKIIVQQQIKDLQELLDKKMDEYFNS